MRILLVRHGESESNINKSLTMRRPDHTIELTQRGREQAVACGEGLVKWTDELHSRVIGPLGGRVSPEDAWRIWHSPYARTTQTAEIIESAMGSRIRDRREHILLGEQQFGLFDGVPDDELPIRFPNEYAHYKKHEDFEGRFWARMPCGESRFDVATRVHQAFGTFHRDATSKSSPVTNLIVVGHGVTIRAFVMMWCHKSVKWFENEPNPKNCSVRFLSDSRDYGYVYGESNDKPSKATCA